MNIRINKETFGLYTYIFLMIVLSNTTFLGLKYRSITLMLSIIILFPVILKHGFKFLKLNSDKIKNCLTFLSLSVLFVVSFMGTDNNLLNFYLGNYLTFIEIFAISFCCSKTYFCKIYTNLLCFFSLISLIGLIIKIFFPKVVMALPMNVTDQGYIYTFFYTWGWDNHGFGLHFSSRNSGPFWEPGAFQGFIILAILMLLDKKETIKIADKKMLLLLITLLTTQSTTGFILLIILGLVFRKDFSAILFANSKNQKIKLMIAIIAVLCVTTWLSLSGIITNKLMQYTDLSKSTGIRLNDTLTSLRLLFTRPFIGLGYGSSRMVSSQIQSGMTGANSNGLLLMLYAMGLPYGVVYIISSIRGIKSMFSRFGMNKIVVICLIFLILHSTEVIFTLPIYMAFLFVYEDTLKGKNNG